MVRLTRTAIPVHAGTLYMYTPEINLKSALFHRGSPGFCSKKWPGLFLLPLIKDATVGSPLQEFYQHKYIYIYIHLYIQCIHVKGTCTCLLHKFKSMLIRSSRQYNSDQLSSAVQYPCSLLKSYFYLGLLKNVEPSVLCYQWYYKMHL